VQENREADGTTVLILNEQIRPAGVDRLRELGLTSKEGEVLLRIERGLTNLEIAEELGVTLSTVKRHIEHIFAKLDVQTRTAAVARARSLI
jgi:ATP/maltotriose-dependent transcriptional regulator MalT